MIITYDCQNIFLVQATALLLLGSSVAKLSTNGKALELFSLLILDDFRA